jgi:hypothetical protein
MKKTFYLFTLLLSFCITAVAQEEEDDNRGGGKLQEKMTEYVQTRLGLSKGEAEKFSPVFLDYFKELRRTNKEFKGDRLVLQQKIVELRLRYRDQFRPIIGEKRSNEVFTYEKEFVDKVREIRTERLQNRPDGRANRRTGGILQ